MAKAEKIEGKEQKTEKPVKNINKSSYSKKKES